MLCTILKKRKQNNKKKKEKKKTNKVMTWMMTWLNRSIATLIVTLQLLDIYLYIYRLSSSFFSVCLMCKVMNLAKSVSLYLTYYDCDCAYFLWQVHSCLICKICITNFTEYMKNVWSSITMLY